MYIETLYLARAKSAQVYVFKDESAPDPTVSVTSIELSPGVLRYSVWSADRPDDCEYEIGTEKNGAEITKRAHSLAVDRWVKRYAP